MPTINDHNLYFENKLTNNFQMFYRFIIMQGVARTIPLTFLAFLSAITWNFKEKFY